MNGVTTRSIATMAILGISLSIGACGGSSSTRPVPMPTPTPVPTQPSLSSAQATVIPIQSCSATAPRFVPTFTLPARDQGADCNGGCWAYATVGAYEQNYAFKSGRAIDVSESQILDCSNKGDCTEGTWAFDFLISTGTTRESDYQHSPTKKACIAGATPLRALQGGLVNGSTPIPPVNMIKDAICAHGAVASGVVETTAFRNHRGGGVFTETTGEPMHHAVVIVGWDDTLGAWRVRNSRTVWGEQGYGWVSYSSNRIGHTAAWVEADAPPRSSAPCPPPVLDAEGGTTASTTC